jgi:hypothetical protein
MIHWWWLLIVAAAVAIIAHFIGFQDGHCQGLQDGELTKLAKEIDKELREKGKKEHDKKK